MRPAEPVRLAFDASRCQGHGMCALRCPERISLDPWGFAVADPEPITDRGTRRRAEVAAACCPEAALAVLPVRNGRRPPQ